MKTEKNILIAFILNLFFSVFEFFGGIFTGSVAIISDALHDLGDAASIGISYFLEKKSKTKPDKKYTYGYAGYSVLGSLITTSILLFGSGAVIYNAVLKLINPSEINYNGMLIFAVIGVIVNFIAALVTKDGDSLNQKAVNLHMLEDVLGWIVVLIGAVVMKFTDFKIIDPIMSIAVAIFILINALSNMKEILSLFFEKVPENINVEELEEHILGIEGVLGIHHIHIWSIDGQRIFATMHIVANENTTEIKRKVKEELKEHGISHSTLELEKENENCGDEHCSPEHIHHKHHHHHHHHHH
jgi:cobalt-zinc-cadmium efflux system protein